MEFDPQVVLFQAEGVGAEALTVVAVEANAGRALDDEVVREDLVLLKAALREIGVGDGAVSPGWVKPPDWVRPARGLVILAVAGDGGVLDEGPLGSSRA